MPNRIIKTIQGVSIVLAIIMILAFTLLIMRKITLNQFWITTGIIGLIAVWVIPRLRKKSENQEKRTEENKQNLKKKK